MAGCAMMHCEERPGQPHRVIASGVAGMARRDTGSHTDPLECRLPSPQARIPACRERARCGILRPERADEALQTKLWHNTAAIRGCRENGLTFRHPTSSCPDSNFSQYRRRNRLSGKPSKGQSFMSPSDRVENPGRVTVGIIGLGSIGGVVAGLLRAVDRHDVVACVRRPIERLVVERAEGAIDVSMRALTD